MSSEINGAISFKNVSYTYAETGITALKNISFEIAAGNSLGIIGHTGSGKSTIAALLCRMYDINQGEIKIDEVPIRKVNLHDLRNATGYVPQEVFLFSDSIKNNIAFGVKNYEANEENIINAAKEAGIYENIMNFPQQFDTLIGERGVTLSGGQKQRISIARAIIKKPRLLIFDDCLSAVDTETEDRILDNLENEMKGRTSLFISHRVSGVKSADKIIFLKDGEIIEQGTHNELLALNAEYAALYRLQTLEKPDK
jgi:ATP-binding cassette, subfamily B, multidrug efflux pump